MATLVSPGVSVTITDESFYVPASAATVPLIFVATQADKRYLLQECPGTKEHSVVRTITSKTQALSTYGVPAFRTDIAGNQLHGDSRNEYGLFALHQFLDVGNRAYVVRANVDLADNDVSVLTSTVTPLLAAGNGTIPTVSINQNLASAQLWTITAVNATQFTVQGFVTGDSGVAEVGLPFTNGEITFTITAGSVPFETGDTFEINVVPTTVSNPLGANDAAKRVTIVQALQSEINSNQEVRSEYYEYNLILCPGYYEVVDELLNLTLNIGEEAFVIADTPFHLTPEQTSEWSLTSERYRSCNVAYYYPHGLASNYDGTDVFVAASGIALKTFTYNDNVGELWFAPAGTRRGQVVGVSKVGYVSGIIGTATTFTEVNLNPGQRDILYEFQKNVNPIVFFPGRGILVWGQKTSMVSASALDRVNVVRLYMHIRRSLRKAMQVFLFEPNDPITREAAKTLADGFLGDIMVRRGLYDFAVVCDDSNNSGTRIDRNELWIDIVTKPVKAVEFIYVPIRVVTTSASLK